MRARLLLTALAATATTLALAPPAGSSAARAGCSVAPSPIDPVETAVRFLTGAVERHDLPGSFRLATLDLRHGITCREWIAGHVSVEAFPVIDWDRASYRVVATGDRQVVLRVVLFAPGKPARAAHAFLMDIRQGEHERGNRWRVGVMLRVPLERIDLRRPRSA